MIIIVTGLPRSGTTCMMRMLEAGGIEPYYDASKPLEFTKNDADYINYNIILRETNKINDLIKGDSKWLDECEGKVVKILNPVKVVMPRGRKYRFIWMDRKMKAIGQSNRKYLMRAGRKNTPEYRAVLNNIRELRAKGIALLKSYANSELLKIKFEKMITKPIATAIEVEYFLKKDLNIDKMAAIVVKRPAFCLPYMLEEKIYT